MQANTQTNYSNNFRFLVNCKTYWFYNIVGPLSFCSTHFQRKNFSEISLFDVVNSLYNLITASSAKCGHVGTKSILPH